MTIAWKNSHFILSGRSEFCMVINLSVVVSALPMHMLILLSVDEILLPRYMNSFTLEPYHLMRK